MIRTTLLAFALLLTAAPAAAREQVERFALVVGANDGGADRVRLRYAATDAANFAAVMTEFGGVDPARLRLLDEPDPPALEAAFAALRAELEGREAGRTEVLVFYSGHSDERGLLLGGQRVTYPALRAHVEALPADVRITILDSCASGAFIRAKGGVHRPPFLVDAAHAVRGQAFLSSASADEAAQESDRIGASYFSHALLTGMRGAADYSRDGKVTLTEAYQFAFDETLARTQGTRHGAQHPSYDIQLAGTGDVVMTDLRSVSARLALAEPLAGRLFIRDATGALVAELHKPAGRPVQLGLAPGRYEVRLDADDGGHRAGHVELTEGGETMLTTDALAMVDAELATARGGRAPEPPPYVPFGFSFVPGLSTDTMQTARGVSIDLLGGVHAGVYAFGASAGFHVITGDARGFLGAAAFNVVQGDASGFVGGAGFNYLAGDADGFAGAAGFNWVAGTLDGVQGAAGFNVARGDVLGGQLAAGVNVASLAVDGVQAAAGLNVAGGPVDGAQIAAGLNVAGGPVDGVQIAVLNIADEVHGAQIGVINIARKVRGASIGVLPIVTEGRHHGEVWGGEVIPLNLGYKIGASHTHAIFGAGLRPYGDDHLLAFNLGLGAHVPFDGPLWMDLDLLSAALVRDYTFNQAHAGTLGQARLVVGWRFSDAVAVFGGPTWNVLIGDPDEPGVDLGFEPALQHEGSSVRVEQWPGLVVGLQI